MFFFFLQSDIYSIGIVLTELLIPIKTQMELSSIISSLKNDTVPEVFKRHKWVNFKYIKLFIIFYIIYIYVNRYSGS